MQYKLKDGSLEDSTSSVRLNRRKRRRMKERKKNREKREKEHNPREVDISWIST